MKYFVSGSLNKSDQPSFNINYEKYTVRAKIDAKLTDRLTFNLNLTAEWDKNVRPNYNDADETGSSLQNDMAPIGNGGGIFSQLVIRQPTVPYTKVIDGVTYPVSEWPPNDVLVQQLLLGQGGTQTYNNFFFNPRATMKYSIPGVQGLNASVQFSYNSKFSKNNVLTASMPL